MFIDPEVTILLVHGTCKSLL